MRAAIMIMETASCWMMEKHVFVFKAFPIRFYADGFGLRFFHWTSL